MAAMAGLERITVNPTEKCRSVAGTRITVRDVLELVKEGLSFEQIVQEYYPDLEVEDVRACVQYAIAIVAAEDIDVATASA